MPGVRMGCSHFLAFVAVCVWSGCGNSTATFEPDIGVDIGVHYTNQDSAGNRLELLLYWDKARAIVGQRTQSDMKTFPCDSLPESEVSAVKGIFTPELMDIYRRESSASSDAGAGQYWLVNVKMDLHETHRLLVYLSAPSRSETVSMLAALDTFVVQHLP
jgi:hypothetical protein